MNNTDFRMNKKLNALVDEKLSKLSTVNARHELRSVALEYLELHDSMERIKSRMDEIKAQYTDAFVECGDTYADNHTAVTIQNHGAPELLEVVVTPETERVDWKRWALEVHGTTAEAVKALGFTTTESRRVRIQRMSANGVKTYRKVIAGRILKGG